MNAFNVFVGRWWGELGSRRPSFHQLLLLSLLAVVIMLPIYCYNVIKLCCRPPRTLQHLR